MRRLTAKCRWIALSAAVLLAAAWLCRGPVLRGLAGLLIVDQPTEDAGVVCLDTLGYVPDGYRCYELVGQLRRTGHLCKVLLIGPAPGRLVETGVVTSFESLSRSALAAQGVPPADVSVLSSDGRSDRALARTLGAWLRAHSAATVLWACPRFRSANVRLMLDTELDPADGMRVRLRALPDYQIDETNWWTSRRGIRCFGIGWLVRLEGWLGGGAAAPPATMSADEYQRRFLSTLKEKSP